MDFYWAGSDHEYIERFFLNKYDRGVRVRGLILCSLVAVFFVFNTKASILPPNNLHLEDNLKNNENMTEEMFNAEMAKVAKVYAPIVALHGANLDIQGDWNSSTVNAYASRYGKDWRVRMYGGLARRSEVTMDGFTMVICHELGHHLAGFPFYPYDWAASEGQSDYYASQVCARRIWGNEDSENAKYRETVSEYVKEKCDASWKSEKQQNLCYRISAAGYSLGNLLNALGNGSDIAHDTPSTNRVSRTNNNHPRAQCRLDTYFQGSLCTQTFDQTLIPGLDHADGQGSKGAEIEASMHSCSEYMAYAQGTRPGCWFASQLTI